MNRLMVIIVLILALIGMPVSGSAESSKEGYRFGVFPYLPTNRINKVYTPVATDFEKTLGVPITLRTKSSYKEFKDALLNEEYDIAFVQPYDYVTAHDQHNYLPLVKRSIPLRTVIIVKKDSSFQGLEQLRGQIIASPAQTAAVSRITDKVLTDHGFDLNKDITRKHKKNHFACMQSVIIGEAAACGTAERALKHFGDVKMRDKFRVLYNAPEIPNSLFIIHNRVPEKDREKLKQSIINWPNTESGKQILSGGRIIPMVPAEDNEYDIIR